MSTGAVEFTAWQLLMMGGPVLAPVLICSVLALAVMIRKFDEFRSADAAIRLLKDRVLDEARCGRIREAVFACDGSDAWAAPVFKAGLMEFGKPRPEVLEAMDDAARVQIPRLEKGLALLGTIAVVTPLMGILGTALGLSSVFHTVQVRAAAMNPVGMGDVAGGIWQALITTAVSLLVAIPVLIAHNYFVHRLHLLVRDMEKAAVRLADLMGRSPDTGDPGKE